MDPVSDAPRACGLPELLAPLGLDHFLERYWQREPLLLQLAPHTFENILEPLGPLEIPRMAELATQGSQAWLNNRYVAHSVFPVGPSDARDFHQAGATLYFLNIPMPALTNGIADCLGVPQDRIVASLFLTPPASGAALHFDKNENFTIQLTGAKRWDIGKEPSLESAPQGHIWGRPLSGDLSALRSDVIQRPRHWVELNRGSLLYIPRGVVHGTEADEASWSLNISYTGFMWLDLVCDGLRRSLLKSPEWRQSVLGIRSSCDAEAQLRNRLPDLLASLREALEPGMIVDIDPRASNRTE
jgi:ribosomal protein L16 Arg81 hydroxylase